MAPVDRDGFWSPRTATIDWCEENYVITPYIAEFWNTVSNLVMIIPPLLGGISAVKQNMEMRLSACHFSILVVGIGSWLFHMTLLYSMQLLDELPMVWGSASLLYALFNMELLSKRANKIVQIGLVLYCSAVTAMYLLNKNAVFHEIAYGLMVGLMVLIGWRCLYRHRDKVLWRFHVASLVTYNIGFVLWLVDNNTCSVLRIHTSYLMAKKKPDIKAGPLSKVTIPKDKDGRPRRFGFVVFKHDASVPYTLKLMANTRLYNRELHLRAREVRTSQNTSDIDSPRSQDSDQSQGSSGNFRSPRDQVYQNSRNFNPDRDDLRSSLQRSNTCPGNIDHMMPRSRRGHNQSGYGSGGNDRYSNQQSSGMYSGNSEGKVNTSDPLLTLDAPCMSTSEVVNPSALDMEIKRQRLMQQQDIMLDTNRQRQPRHHDQSYAPYSRGRSDSRYADERRNRRY